MEKEMAELFTLLVQKEGTFGGETKGSVMMSVRARDVQDALDLMQKLLKE